MDNRGKWFPGAMIAVASADLGWYPGKQSSKLAAFGVTQSCGFEFCALSYLV